MNTILFHPEISTRRALILTLGMYTTHIPTIELSAGTLAKLSDLDGRHPDAGIHGAAEWTLRNWEQGSRIDEINARLRGKDRGSRRWYLTRQGLAFSLIEGPIEFRMGSPGTEPDRGQFR